MTTRVEQMEEAARETCRNWIGNDRCNKRAEFILWGKLLPSEALGPRCYDCAAKQIGHHALYPHSGYAVFDLRPFLPVETVPGNPQ